jgi:hypothetical protein
MDFQHKKQGRMSVLLSGLLFVVLCGCSVIPQPGHHTPGHIEHPIITPYQPYRVVQVCLDTPPLFPARLMHEATSAIADRIDSAVTVNLGGLLVFVSYISHDSYQNAAIQFSVPAFPADPAFPPPPKLGDDPYANAQLQSEYQKAFAAWQEALISQHHQLTLLRAQVKKWTDTLRSLPAPFDNTGADVYGCLQNASQHFQGVTSEKFLLIASPLVNNTMLQASRNIKLASASVRVIWHTCTIASTCQTNNAYWLHMFLKFGATDVTFYDPAQSAVEKPTF